MTYGASLAENDCDGATGYLVSVDAYMNLQLANTEEFIEGQFTGNLGEVLIRYACCDGCVASWSSLVLQHTCPNYLLVKACISAYISVAIAVQV